MATDKNPAPRANAGSRAYFKTERKQNRTSTAACKGGPLDFDAINRAALTAFPAALARILPGCKRVGKEIVALNPRRADRHLGSFKVNRDNGCWADFATGDKGGDPISLVAYVENISQFDAALRLAQMLGVEIRRSPRGRAR
jgi:hypothetical protein